VHSRWFGYIQSLPEKIVDLAIFWNLDAQSQDGTEALQWLRGSEVEKLFFTSGDRQVKLLEEIDQYYYNVVEPHFHEFFDGPPPSTPPLRDFYRAYSLVSSRAFLVDAYHGLSMVPIADAFNHAQDNNVHLESNYDVCPECGSFQRCPHDRNLHESDIVAPPMNTFSSETTEYVETYDMISNTPISPNSEVFNTYGETLSNAQLLVQYGFILDDNDNDRITWDVIDLPPLPNLINQAHSRNLLASAFSIDFIDSERVFYDPTATDKFCLNADGKISHHLWLHLAFLAASNNGFQGDDRALARFLHEVFDLQLSLESRAQIGEEKEIEPASQRIEVPSPASQCAMAELARSVMSLCHLRKQRTGKNLTTTDIGDILDGLPDDMPRTRMAISVVMTEHTILESCEASWADILRCHEHEE